MIQCAYGKFSPDQFKAKARGFLPRSVKAGKSGGGAVKEFIEKELEVIPASKGLAWEFSVDVLHEMDLLGLLNPST